MWCDENTIDFTLYALIELFEGKQNNKVHCLENKIV